MLFNSKVIRKKVWLSYFSSSTFAHKLTAKLGYSQLVALVLETDLRVLSAKDVLC